MGACNHRYRDQGHACLQPSSTGSGLCLWHNAAVRKDAPYVRELLAQADVTAKGDLAEFHLVGLSWPNAPLPLRNLRCADLRDVILDGADLNGCDLTGAILRRASLKHCDLRGAHLAGADLSGANLCEADLRDTDMTGAVIDNTLLMGANLAGANLAGAVVKSFRWNRRTCFIGVKGFEPRHGSDAEAPTQAFLAPLAHATHEADPSALADVDPDELRTREFVAPVETNDLPSPPSTTVVSLNQTATTAHAPRWLPWTVAAALLVAGTGVTVGILGWRSSARPMPSAAAHIATLEHERETLKRQHEADLAEIRRVQDREREAGSRVAALSQELTLRRAELEATRTTLREAQLEAGQRQSAEDRAAFMGLTVRELESINGELARHGSRQERLSRVLANGVTRLDHEKAQLAQTLEQNRADTKRLATLEQEVQQLNGQLNEAKRERETLTEQNRRMLGDLLTAQRDIERYLTRISGTHLQEALVGDRETVPLLAVSPGTPIALSGDYLLTLRVDKGPQAGSIQAQVVVQRPSSAANPEVTVVLYDAELRPLRRIAYSFPHVDSGSPLVTSTTITACDRFPAFVRIQVAPGLDGITAAR